LGRADPLSEQAAAGAGGAERVVRPEFRGSAAEYFRIWIVNLLFTLLTLGVYSAWAKVRKQRYLYGSTRLDGDSFNYFGSARAILKGRIVAVAVFLAYAMLTELYPFSIWAFLAAGVALLPLVLVRALRFNARMSAWRGLRFDFPTRVREALPLYLGMPLLVLATLGLAFPWFMAKHKQFVVSHHAYGTSPLGCNVPVGKVYGIYVRAGLIAVAVGVVAVLGAMLAAPVIRLIPQAGWAAFLLPVLATYVGYAFAYAFLQARLTNLVWAGTYGAGVRFSSTLGAIDLAWLYLGNLLAIVFTLGLAVPWAVVRTLRYRLENFAMLLSEEVVHEAAPALLNVSATGQELGEIFNVNFGV
jgi:uncharacterized membrane protein YjgN (DUF898 family)